MNDDVATHEDRYLDDIPEYVLGVLDGRSRSALIEHLAACDECADEVESLTAASDAMVRLPAGAEPPVGFETRVLDRLRQDQRNAPRRRWAAVAAVVVVVALGVGWTIGHGFDTSNGGAASAKGSFDQHALVAGTMRVGTVYAYAGRPAWMFVSVDVPRGPESVRCVVVTKGGVHHDIGAFALHAGLGSWGTPLPVATDQIRAIELTTSSGLVVASARTAGGSTSTYGAK